MILDLDGTLVDSNDAHARAWRIGERRADIFKKKYLPQIQPFPRVRELLQRFVDDGLTLAVASSAKEDELTPLLARARRGDNPAGHYARGYAV